MALKQVSNPNWATPQPVNDVLFVFPARIIGVLIPDWDLLPCEFQNGTSGFEELARHACFNPVELRPDVLIDGVDATVASRQLNAIARSFEPKHEHKEAALAYLLSLWLKPSADATTSGGD